MSTEVRKTFNDKVDVCYQKQKRDDYSDEGTPDVPHLDVGRARVRRVAKPLATQIIKKYEWLGTMSITSHHYGIFFGDYCAGVTCVGCGAATGGANVHEFYGVHRNELATLARGACVHWAPTDANSKLVSWSMRLLAKDTNAKVCVAYSDTDAGEIGTIYQACNWTYVGAGSSVTQYVAPNGYVYDQKVVHNHAQKNGVEWKTQQQALLDAGWEKQKSNPKHRYVWVLDDEDDELNKHIEGMSQEYPKRDR